MVDGYTVLHHAYGDGAPHQTHQREIRHEAAPRYPWVMPAPRRPLSPAPAKRLTDRTPAERAKSAIDRLEHVLGDRSRVQLKVDVVISRAAAERLIQTAMEKSDTMTFSVLLASILEGAAEEMDRAASTAPTRKSVRLS